VQERSAGKRASMGRTRSPTKSMQARVRVPFPKRVTDHDLSEPCTRDTGKLRPPPCLDPRMGR
jgi:hypothetical protein